MFNVRPFGNYINCTICLFEVSLSSLLFTYRPLYITSINESCFILESRMRQLMEVENFPDLWFRKNEQIKYNEALERAAKFLVTFLFLFTLTM